LKRIKQSNYAPAYHPEIAGRLAWNYLIHSIEGGLYVGGMAFIATNTILPRLIEFLKGPAWIISLMPTLTVIGASIPPILTAHHIERLGVVKPLLLFTGFFQRLPFLLAALALFFLSDTQQVFILVVVVLTPFLSGLIGGVSSTAWQELIIKTIPENKRSSLFAIRFIISAGIGIVAGGIIAAIFNQFPGIRGYGMLHLIAFCLIALSYVFFSMVREKNQVPGNRWIEQNLKRNLQQMLRIIRFNRSFQNYLIARAFMNGAYIMMPYLAIYALRTLGKPDSFMGPLVTSQMLGGIAGNIVAGFLGDRYGGKSVLLFSNLMYLIVCTWSLITRLEWAFIAIFFVFGAGYFTNQVGNGTISLELCPYEKRATYLALIAFFDSITLVSIGMLSAIVWQITENFPFLAALSIVTIGFSTKFLLMLQEPRKALICTNA